MFPGKGPEDASLEEPAGWTNVTAERGSYIDNWLGMGGTGPILVSPALRRPARLAPRHSCGAAAADAAAPHHARLRGGGIVPVVRRPRHRRQPPAPFPLQAKWSCLPGELVTGLHVSWNASTAAPATDLATGLRIYCENPNTCGGGPVPSPSPTPSPTPVPSPVASQPPPAAAPSPPNATQAGWSPWVGAGKGPGSYGGVCPCGTFIEVWARTWQHACCSCLKLQHPPHRAVCFTASPAPLLPACPPAVLEHLV